MPAELERIGCTWSSTAHEFWAACSKRLSPNGKYDELCEGMAEDMVETHGIMAVSQMLDLYRHQWEDLLKARGAKLGWVETFMRILGSEFKIMPHEKQSSVPVSALKLQLEEQLHHKNSFNAARFGNQSSNLGAALKMAGKLDKVTLPASVLEAPTECPDVTRYALSYNDVKAVSTAIFVWILKEYKTVYIDKTFAQRIEKLLHDAKFRLTGNDKTGEPRRWWKVIYDRMENGRRKHAKVCHRTNRTRLESNSPAQNQTRHDRAHSPFAAAARLPQRRDR